MATIPNKNVPAEKTSLLNVQQTFNRYYGRNPLESDKATIKWLTQFSPTQVEKELAKNSPITKGKLWHEYQQQAPKVNELHSFIDASDHSPEEKALLKFIADNDKYISNNPQLDAKETAQILQDAATQAEIDIGPYFDKIKSQDLDDLKKRMGDLRLQANMYKQEEALNYKQRLRQTKENLAAQGLTFSGTARRTLGKEGALNSAGVEGELPMDRRYAWERSSDQIQRAARDMGIEAERRYGSRELGKMQDEFGAFPNPYNGGLDYDAKRTGPMYNVKKIEDDGTPQEGYIRQGDQTQYATGDNRRFAATYDLDRQAAIERERNRRVGLRAY